MNKQKFLMVSALVLILGLAGCSSSDVVNDSIAEIEQSGKIMPQQDLTYDWGDIDIAAGTVAAKFDFKNGGDEDLILKGAVTSCMCTTATFNFANGDKSPDFGMHENREWVYAVEPGERFSIDVVFDPMAHGPDAVGPISRSIYLSTSSVENGNYAEKVPGTEATITEIKAIANVLYSDEYKMQSLESKFINISPEEFSNDLVNKDFFLVDVHIPEQEHIEKTDIFIAYDEIADNLASLPEDKEAKIILYCRSGSMSIEAANTLTKLGYKNVYNLEGGRDAFVEYLNNK